MLGQRINRIVGQLRGIQRMIEKKRDCNEILQQVSAVKKAIDSLSKEVVLMNSHKYFAKNAKKVEELLERVINL